MKVNKVYIIAEAGVNHNGSLQRALDLIDVAAEAGVDAVKFQTFKASKLVTKDTPKAEYQKKLTSQDESQYEMLSRLEINEEFHNHLINRCKERNIEFLSTPFDEESLELLTKKFSISSIKVSSGDLTNAPLLLAMAKTKKTILLSTGMSTLSEIEQALSVVAFGYINEDKQPSIEEFQRAYFSEIGQQAIREKVTLLHCTTEYPTPVEEVNLLAMDTLRNAFQLEVGYSDHTEGIVAPIAAVARGAKIIEKHFTLDRTLPGPDHKASLEPNELVEMVKSIRQVERMLGNPIKVPSRSEMKNKDIAKKSIIAACSITENEEYTEKNLTIKRPGNGISPYYFWELIGKTSNRNYLEDELIRR